MDKKFRANVLVSQLLEMQRDRALEEAQLSEEEFSKLDLEPGDMASVVMHYPLALTISRFVNTKEALELVKAAAKFDSGSFGTIAQAMVKKTLNDRRTLLAGFYVEAARIESDNDGFFADNLILEIVDVLLEGLPIAILFAPDENVSKLATACAALASDIKAQIVWGSVADWDSFRQDVLTLRTYLVGLEISLGNNPGNLTKLNGAAIDPLSGRDAYLAYQALIGLARSNLQ